MENYFYERRGHQPEIPRAGVRRTPCQPKWPRRRIAIRFFCAVALIVAAAVTLGLLGSPEEPALSGRDTAPPAPEAVVPGSGGTVYDITTIERAGLGDGTTLPLAAQPEGECLSFQEIYRQTVDCVVGIRGTAAAGVFLGTGVIFSEDGYIVTNAHVIEGCERAEIILADEQEYSARLVGMDSETDLAVLKIEADNLKPAVFGDSDSLQVGDVALAIGNPLNEYLRGTMTDGIISAINRDVKVDGYTMTLIQTTAALNSGNSGGALLNAYGQVVGITNMKMHSYYSVVEGLGFAIPSTTVKHVVDNLIAQGYVAGRPSIGITVSQLTEDAARKAGCPAGLRVEEVKSGSDAWNKGIQAGDVVVEANGAALETTDDLLAVRAGLTVGDTIRLRLWRNGDWLDVEVILVEQHLLEP